MVVIALPVPTAESDRAQHNRWQHPSEPRFIHWMRQQGLEVKPVPGQIVLPGSPFERIVPDFELPELGILGELTTCSEVELSCPLPGLSRKREKARAANLERLHLKRSRLERLHEYGIRFVLIEGDVYDGIMNREQLATSCFWELIGQELGRDSDQLAA